MKPRVRVWNTFMADATELATCLTRLKIARQSVRILRFEPNPQKPSKFADSRLTRDHAEHFSSNLHSTVKQTDAKNLPMAVSSLKQWFSTLKINVPPKTNTNFYSSHHTPLWSFYQSLLDLKETENQTFEAVIMFLLLIRLIFYEVKSYKNTMNEQNKKSLVARQI